MRGRVDVGPLRMHDREPQRMANFALLNFIVAHQARENRQPGGIGRRSNRLAAAIARQIENGPEPAFQPAAVLYVENNS